MTGALDRAAVVALVRLAERPPHRYADLLDQPGQSPRTLLQSELTEQSGQPTLLPPDPEPRIREAERDIERWQGRGFDLLTVLDEAYPENLRDVHDRPPLVFVAGSLQERDTHAVAIVGSRRASPAGIASAEVTTRALVAAEYVVVSGLATGVDTAAHTAALAAGGRTVAVLGTGLEHSYPPQNRDLQRRIAAHGALISQFWPEDRPTRRSFPMRNAVMSGLSRATVVIEASDRSGALVQARQALAHGRPVFLPRRICAEPWAHRLALKPGVHVIDAPEEIVETVERLAEPDALVE